MEKEGRWFEKRSWKKLEWGEDGVAGELSLGVVVQNEGYFRMGDLVSTAGVDRGHAG